MNNESEVNEYVAGLERVKKMRFGCIVENLYASKNNPHRFSIFIRTRQQRGRVVAECTDGKGSFWLGGIERLFFRELPPRPSKLLDRRPFNVAMGKMPRVTGAIDIMFRDRTQLYDQAAGSWDWEISSAGLEDDDIVGWRKSK